MKRVLIIYTGGTIGMTRTENGYAPRAGYFRAALDAIPDLRAPEMPEWEFYELSPLLDSSNMTVREWNCIAELIAQKYDDYDGFVVLHGTDTMAYTASALSFMLDGLDKPVVLTGSQIPQRRARQPHHRAADCGGRHRARGVPVLRRKAAARQPRDKILRRRTHRFRFAQLPEPCRGGHFHQI